MDCATVGALVPPLVLSEGRDHRFLGGRWNPWPEAQVWSAIVVMLHPFLQHHPQMFQRNQEIQTLTAKGSHQPFTVGIRFRRLDWRSQHF